MSPKKSEKVENFLENLSWMAYGRSRKHSMESAVCVFCGQPAKEFKNEISAREYEISGMCQLCQDAFFEHLPLE
jgi:uncharacterized CHY-type Zn-finger protein